MTELIERCLAMARARGPGRARWVHLPDTDHTTADHTRGDRPDGRVACLEGYGPITAEAAQHLLDTGHARPPPPPPGGLLRVTWGGALRHDPPAAMDREVRARDGRCRFPTCRAPARRGDLDHTIRFPDGITTHANLAALCRRHHRIKHRGGWTVHQDAHGVLRWTSPTGTTYTTYPRRIDDTGPGATSTSEGVVQMTPTTPTTRA